jgi:hypothetical protein
LDYNRLELKRQFANDEAIEGMVEEVSKMVHSAFKNK